MKRPNLLLLFIALVACQTPPSKDSTAETEPKRIKAEQIARAVEKAGPIADTLEAFKGLPEHSDSLLYTSIIEGGIRMQLEGEFEVNRRGDTLIISEGPLHYIYQRWFKAMATDTSKVVKCYISVHELLDQVYPYSMDDSTRPDYNQWRSEAQHWQAWSDFKYIDLSPGEFRFPMLNRGHNQEPPDYLYERLNLIDTFIDIPGERGGTQAEVLFLDKPAAYYIQKALLKLELYDEGLLQQETNVLIRFSYGC